MVLSAPGGRHQAGSDLAVGGDVRRSSSTFRPVLHETSLALAVSRDVAQRVGGEESRCERARETTRPVHLHRPGGADCSPARGRGRHLGHAGSLLRFDVPIDGSCHEGGLQPGALLVASPGAEERDRQSRGHLPAALHQYERRRGSRAGDSSRRRGCDQRHRPGLLAGAVGRCRARRRGQGQGRQVSDPAARPRPGSA